MATSNLTTAAESERDTLDFTPYFTLDAVDEIDPKYDDTWGVSRRMMMTTLCFSREFLAERIEQTSEGADLALFMAEQIAAYQKHLEGGIELAKIASARLMAVAADIEAKHA